MSVVPHDRTCSFDENNFSIACIFNCLVSSTTTKNQRLFVIPFLIWPLKVNGCLDDLKKDGILKMCRMYRKLALYVLHV